MSLENGHFPLLNEFEAVQRVEADDGVLVLVVQHQPLRPRLATQPLGQGAQLAPAEERVDLSWSHVSDMTCDMMSCVTLPEVEVSELQLGHRVHTPAQAGELRVVEAHVRQVELPGTVMNHVNIASCLVLAGQF